MSRQLAFRKRCINCSETFSSPSTYAQHKRLCQQATPSVADGKAALPSTFWKWICSPYANNDDGSGSTSAAPSASRYSSLAVEAARFHELTAETMAVATKLERCRNK